MNQNRLPLVLMLGLLAGCGGSGGSSTDTSPEPPPPTPPVDTSGDGAAAILAPSGFDFSTTEPLTIKVVQATAHSADRYLTVCLPDSESTVADYSKCLLRAPLRDAVFANDIMLPNDTELLEIEIWSLRDANVVTSMTWRRPTDGFQPVRIEL
ncbi:MAG: hypothetical protein AAF351_03810 [Pseudomonadota bacterium]